jgi:hypothetical protein
VSCQIPAGFAYETPTAKLGFERAVPSILKKERSKRPHFKSTAFFCRSVTSNLWLSLAFLLLINITGSSFAGLFQKKRKRKLQFIGVPYL